MLSRYLKFIAPVFLLLWLVGTNHCAFEGNASHNGQCPSHQAGDGGSHAEGKPCQSQLVQPSGSQNDLLKVEISNDFVPTFVALFTDTQTAKFPALIFEEVAISSSTAPLVSLSIASNAPPVLA